MRCEPRFNYATSDHELQISDRCATFFPAHDSCPPMSLYSSVGLEAQSQDVTAEFSLQAGETAIFVLGGLRVKESRRKWISSGNASSRQAQFWKSVDFKVELQGPLARNGSTFGFGVEAAY